VVNVVAAANTGYLLVFVILPVGFVMVRRRRSRAGDALVMPRWMTAVALVFAVFNAILLVAGATLWGPRIWLTGAVVMTVVFPLMMLRAREEKRAR
jgi:amino acid transporter